MPSPLPILFVGDNPALPGGLSRIGRDLATLTSRLPEFRVGYMGRGGMPSRQLPFMQYPYLDEHYQWGELLLPDVWKDFAGDQSGIIFTIWDASRLHWFSQPHYCPDQRLKEFLTAGHFARWGYFPIDSTGPMDRLTTAACDTLLGYNRILLYTEWASGLVKRSIGEQQALRRDGNWLPHGLNLNTFQPMIKRQARQWCPRFHSNDTVIGVVATNQARKDWGLVAMTASLLRERIPRLRFWWHTDIEQRYWNLHALLSDYHLGDITVLTTSRLTDQQMAMAYNGCDLTLHPGLGEGFCYPLVESLACGVPAIIGDYAGAAELLESQPQLRIVPSEMRLDTLHNCFRPVFSPQDWAERSLQALAEPLLPEECRALVEHLGWDRLWHQWRKWILGGLA